MLDSCDSVIDKCRHDSGDDMIKMEAIVTMEVEVDVIVVAGHSSNGGKIGGGDGDSNNKGSDY